MERIVTRRFRTWPWTKARSHGTDIFNELTICLVSGLNHSSRVIGRSVHDAVEANLELAEEGVDLKHRLVRRLVLQTMNRSVDIFETPVEIVLDFREANREISRGKDRLKEPAYRFAITSNSFCPNAFDRALVPKRARSSGSPLDHGRVVSKKWRSFSLASSGVIRAWSWL